MVLKLTSILLLGLLTGCQTSKKNFSPSGLNNFKSFLRKTINVKCSVPGGCKDLPIGMVVSLLNHKKTKSEEDEFEYDRCTGFFIGPDTVATNAHCLPTDIQKNHSDCKGRIFFNLPNEKNKIYECQKIITVSNLKKNIVTEPQDYTFFKVDSKYSGSPYTISREGFPDNQWYNTYTINPKQNNELSGELVKKRCKSVLKSAFMPEYQNTFSPIVAFGDCEIIQGNSGSPIIKNGKVRGLIQTNGDRNILSLLVKDLSKIQVAHLSGGSSFTCIPTPNEPFSKRSECTVKNPGSFFKGNELNGFKIIEPKKIRKKIQQSTLRFRKDNSEMLIWMLGPDLKFKTHSSAQGVIFSLKPECIRGERLPFWETIRRKSVGKLYFNQPIWKFEMSFNRYLQGRFQIEKIEEQKSLLNINLEMLEKTGVTSYSLKEPNTEELFYSDSISFCEESSLSGL
ncbi:MAG: hypothetical protein CL678_12660 [Bdellovibrionaceae bacterium]|nr:hypothetical protein [Pseudobdellovibrionaceae bacterium]|tara:strand:- start:6691 stop:8049 length:1359 start_codon:yes stop_codon:yes gene_type:complete